jgi:uncharacterized OB-fold protein
VSEKRLFIEGVLRETENGPILLGNRCARCDKVFFPKVDFCPQCLSEDLEERELSQKGTLHAHTVTRVPLERFDPPHPLGVVLLPKDRVSVLAPLVLRENEELTVGAEMEVVVAPLWLDEDGAQVYGYKFQKCGGRDR